MCTSASARRGNVFGNVNFEVRFVYYVLQESCRTDSHPSPYLIFRKIDIVEKVNNVPAALHEYAIDDEVSVCKSVTFE